MNAETKLEIVRDWTDFMEWLVESVNGDEEVESNEEGAVGEEMAAAA